MNKISISVSLMILIAVCVSFGCKSETQKTNDAASFAGAIELATQTTQTTPKGAVVHSVKGFSAEQLAAVDAGLEQAFDAARESGYTQKLDFGFYEISTPKNGCELSPVDHVPSWRIRGDNYDGTEYDVDPTPGKGVIYAAEMVLSVGTTGSRPDHGWFVVCQVDDLNLQTATARYGAEHVLAGNNDPDYFGRTYTHTSCGHPILPESNCPAN